MIKILRYLLLSLFRIRQYPAHESAAKAVSISPAGLMPNCWDPFSTTVATPINANTVPSHANGFIESLKISLPRIIVKIGAQQIIRDTFDANVMLNAEFSAIKYNDPPVIPAASIMHSSFIPSAHSLSCENTSVHRYATAKRIMKISTGLSPSAIRTLVETNVTPQTMIVANAMMLYIVPFVMIFGIFTVQNYK